MQENAAFISWIGDVDLVEYIISCSPPKRSTIFSQLTDDQNKDNINRKYKEGRHRPSPIVITLKKYSKEICTVYLMTNRIYCLLNESSDDGYKAYLRESCGFTGEIVVCDHSNINIADLPGIYKATQSTIEKLIRPHHSKLYCNLTSGAGVTASAIVLLASAYFEDCVFCQTYENEVSRSDPPPESFANLIRKREIKEAVPDDELIAQSPKMKAIWRDVERVAPFDYSVLLLGPSGTGKSMVARKIREHSARKDKPFRHVNCGGLTPTLLESRLFGHKEGAFTGATKNVDGEFKKADGGTLFLDEVADCPPEMQVMLLNALQPLPDSKPTERKFTVMGGEEETSDVRIIAATNKPLTRLIEEGKFREDLFYRLASTRITMPALCEHPEDILPIAKSYLSSINKKNNAVPGYIPKQLSQDAETWLCDYAWPGNVRELQNVLQESAMFTDGGTIRARDLRFHEDENQPDAENSLPKPEDFSLGAVLEDIERRYINAALRASNGNKAEASRKLGMKTPQNLESRIKALNHKIKGFSPTAP